jgi:hypothetical protein
VAYLDLPDPLGEIHEDRAAGRVGEHRPGPCRRLDLLISEDDQRVGDVAALLPLDLEGDRCRAAPLLRLSHACRERQKREQGDVSGSIHGGLRGWWESDRMQSTSLTKPAEALPALRQRLAWRPE